jgi:hypothetical protein
MDEATPPTAAEVAERATVLLAVAMRGLLEDDFDTDEVADAELIRSQLVTGLSREAQLWDALSDGERELLDTPVGALDSAATDAAIWMAEGAQVLLWALQRRELPAPDAQEHPFALARSVGVVSNVGGIPNNWLLLRSPRLRSPNELEAMRQRLRIIHRRLAALLEAPGQPVDRAAFAGAAIEGIALCAGDLLVDGRAASAADAAVVARVHAIAEVRLRAAEWLVGV